MSGAKITPAFQDYDHTLALVDGAVTVEGYDLKTTTISPPSRIFLRMLNKEEFDASEMSLSNYMIALEHGDRRFVAIPVFRPGCFGILIFGSTPTPESDSRKILSVSASASRITR